MKGGILTAGNSFAPGAVGLHLIDGLPLLRPDEQVFTAMLDGWRNQQLARNLAFSTIESRERAVRAFTRHADTFPWAWSPQMADEWMGDLRSIRNLRRSTLPKAPTFSACCPKTAERLLQTPRHYRNLTRPTAARKVAVPILPANEALAS